MRGVDRPQRGALFDVPYRLGVGDANSLQQGRAYWFVPRQLLDPLKRCAGHLDNGREQDINCAARAQ